jgi:DNA-binding transcriptional regulator YiaG
MRAVASPAVEALHQSIASALASKAQRLQPSEVRFLRKHLGLSGRDFASLLRVTPGTVSRWENPKRESGHIGETSELLLRTLILSHQKSISSYEDLFSGERKQELLSGRCSGEPGTPGRARKPRDLFCGSLRWVTSGSVATPAIYNS